MGVKMNEMHAKERIQFIQEMIEKTKRNTAGSWMFLLVWGTIGVLGVIGMYVLVYFEKFSWIWVNWIIFVTIGFVYSLFKSAKQRTRGLKTYAQIAVRHLCLACGIVFILVGFIFPMLSVYSWGLIAVFISLVAGILVFVAGGIYDWNLLKWCGVIWWLGALGMVFVHEYYRAILFIPLILVGYIMPAIVLRSIYQKDRERNAS
jgi:hypothetical protein